MHEQKHKFLLSHFKCCKTMLIETLLFLLQRLCAGNPNHVFSGTVIPFQIWKWSEQRFHNWKQKQCVTVWDFLSEHPSFISEIPTMAFEQLLWVRGLELAQIIWHYLSNCLLGLAQIIWHYRAPRNRTTWIQQSLIIMSWWRKERRKSCVFGVLGYLSLWMGNINGMKWVKNSASKTHVEK